MAPASLNESNYKHYRDRVQGVSRPLHYTLGQAGWEAVADYAPAWALEQAALPAPS